MNYAAWYLVIVIAQSYGGDKVQLHPFPSKSICNVALAEISAMAKGKHVDTAFKCIPGYDSLAK